VGRALKPAPPGSFHQFSLPSIQLAINSACHSFGFAFGFADAATVPKMPLAF
jgi:hypothetical protein